MIAELKGAALLEGVRGKIAVDKAALVAVMLKIGGADGLLQLAVGEVSEIDLNPVIVSPHGAVVADARIILTKAPADSTPCVDTGVEPTMSALERFRPLFEPKTVAVLGASTTNVTIANTFIRRMKAFGYSGEIYPIHPKAPEVEGLVTYPSLGQTPQPVDYAYVAIGAERFRKRSPSPTGAVGSPRSSPPASAKSRKALSLNANS